MAIRNFLKTSALSALVASLALVALPAEARDGDRMGGGQVRVEGGERPDPGGNWGGSRWGGNGGQARPQAPVARPAPPPVQRALPPAKVESGTWRGQGGFKPQEPRGGWGGRTGGGNPGVEGGRDRPAWRGPQTGTVATPQPARPPETRPGWNGDNRNGENRWSGRDGRNGDNRWSGRDGRRDQPAWRGNGSSRNWHDGNRDNRDQRWRDGNRHWRGDRDRHRWADRDRHRWNHDWRRDRQYDWYAYRNHNRHVYRMGHYYAPYRDYYYSRVGVGFVLDSLFYSSNYWISDPWQYRLPPVDGPYRWVRYYDDVLLVDIYTGEVVDAINGFFW